MIEQAIIPDEVAQVIANAIVEVNGWKVLWPSPVLQSAERTPASVTVLRAKAATATTKGVSCSEEEIKGESFR